MTVPIVLPPLGEGILEVRVLACLKQAGDEVSRDEPLVEVETDKANFVIESPATGVVGEWSVQAGDTYPVGTVMTTILQSGAGHPPVPSPRPASPPLRNRRASPRVRALCASKGIDLNSLSNTLANQADGRLSIEDIEPSQGTPIIHEANGAATVEVHVNLEFLDVAKRRLDVTNSELVGWCIFRAMERHLAFRATMVRGALTWSDQATLGVAVALLHGGLSVAPIDRSDDLSAFARAFRRAVSAARSKQKSLRPCSVILSDMSSFEIRSATPIVVAPSIATVFVGEPFRVPTPSMDGIAWIREAKMILAFNHDLINGVAAARFLREIRRNIEGL